MTTTSTPSDEDSNKLISESSKSLDSILMKIKGWAKTGSDPPKELSEDGVSITFARLTWYPKPDLYKLNIQSLNFLKKKRKIPCRLNYTR